MGFNNHHKTIGMKKINFIIVCLTLFAISSCKKLLDEKLVSTVNDQYLNSKAGFEDAVKATYSSLRNFYGSERGMSLTVFGTDSYTRGSDGSWKFVNDYTSQLDARTGIVTEVWNEFYKAINTANAVVGRADKVVGFDPVLKDKRVAEARFLRAQYYFILVQMFGPVHLTLQENTAAISTASRAPIASIYKAIIADLEFAVSKLEPDIKKTDYGRATKPAAEHLLAKVYLTRATSSAKETDDYSKAAQYAKNVINNYSFRLLPDYAKVFEQGAGETNDEVIWSVQYTSDPLTNSTGNNAHVFFLMEYDVQPGMQRDVANGRPFKRFRPTNFTLGLWDRNNDSRYDKNFKSVFYCNKPGTYSINGKTVTLASGDTAIWLPGVELSASVIAGKNYQVIPPSKYTPKLYPSLTKFLDPLRPDKTTFEGSRDFLAFRLAETYLIAAEASMYIGNLAEAAGYVNKVRRRAAYPGKELLMEITPVDLTIDFILDERDRELLGEQLRWFDLTRTGKLFERVKKYNVEAAPGIKDFHILRPIPQSQIDLTEGGATAFPQNAGY